MYDMFMRFTMDSFGSMGLGHDFNTLEGDEPFPFAKAFDSAQYRLDRGRRKPWYCLRVGWGRWVGKVFQVHAQLCAFLSLLLCGLVIWTWTLWVNSDQVQGEERQGAAGQPQGPR